jgi:hypothetical protein
MIDLILALLSACFIHEGGHFLAARAFGRRLKFSFKWAWLWKIPIPRFTWTMPIFFATENWKRKTVALAGFGAEFFAVPIFYVLTRDFIGYYWCVALCHFILSAQPLQQALQQAGLQWAQQTP